MFEEELEKASALYGLPLDRGQIEKFAIYCRLLIEWNEKMNLTAITEPKEVAVKHMVDSLTALRGIEDGESLRLIDVGTGAGFPGIPLKIVRPDMDLLLLDSLKKRVRFLETVVETLGFKGAACLHGRAEEAAREKGLRERFDVAVSRAVARLPVLAEYLLPFVRVGGRAIALKGLHSEEEAKEARRAAEILGGALIETIPVSLPGLSDRRAVLVMKKERATPKIYPRKAGTPAKEPLL
ncbi:16S rRNA (guanine(527)-N(7))-methyltransferase RsmG [uncultured Selenomonas sp.]|uniref:16S rRNA (guanine(527)-N(7))-methyltransferase RsmG n=1 Tax=uncultured Selenomonas sp. TaxID=159275 RepID=UPI0028DBAE79|nr:16S rRNA (guanine(527)-N(7))-methyltransferase RsmG [uncultured Selenomonas sp.]